MASCFTKIQFNTSVVSTDGDADALVIVLVKKYKCFVRWLHFSLDAVTTVAVFKIKGAKILSHPEFLNPLCDGQWLMCFLRQHRPAVLISSSGQRSPGERVNR